MARIAAHSSKETKASIKNAFLELYENERLEKITISAITKKAAVNRSTFYYYYKDVYDILEQLEQEYLHNLSHAIPTLIHIIVQPEWEQHIAQLLTFYQTYKRLVMLFLVKKPNAHIIDTTVNFARTTLLQSLGIDKDALSMDQQFIVQYIAHAQIGIISWWLSEQSDLPINDLIRMIRTVSLQGPFTALENSIQNSHSILSHKISSYKMGISDRR